MFKTVGVTHFSSFTHTHLLQTEMSRYCRSLRVATDLRQVSVILRQCAAWSLLRPGELLHTAFQLRSESWLLPEAHVWVRNRQSNCSSHTSFHTCCTQRLWDLTLYTESLQLRYFSDGFEGNVGKMSSIQQRHGRQTATSGEQCLLEESKIQTSSLP